MAQRLLANISTIFFDYKRNALRRSLKWELTKEEFIALVSKPCFYCGARPKRRNFKKSLKRVMGRWESVAAQTKEKLNGIDRVDGVTGYRVSNCVPCCKRCNYLKSNLSLEDFVSHIKKIIKHMEA